MHRSIADLLADAREANRGLPETVLQAEIDESGRSEEEIRQRIRKTLRVMNEAIHEGLKGEVRSPSGLSGGRAARLFSDGPRLMGDRVTAILSRAIATLEVNAAMGLIVAAPTAGAAGVLPAIILSAGEILEAARIDGCSELRIWWGIMMPLTVPALAALATLEFTWIFNDYLWAIVLLRSDSLKPVTAGLATLQGQYVTDWTVITPAGEPRAGGRSDPGGSPGGSGCRCPVPSCSPLRVRDPGSR